MKHFYRIDVHDFYSRNVFFAFNAVSEAIMSEIGISNQQFLYKLFLCKEQQLFFLHMKCSLLKNMYHRKTVLYDEEKYKANVNLNIVT